jgi:TonB family protein
MLPIVKSVEPKYPLIARKANVGGTVWVKVLVNERGDVVKACVEQGHPLLAASAYKATLQWKFAPNFGLSLKSKGKAKLLDYYLTFDFNLDK